MCLRAFPLKRYSSIMVVEYDFSNVVSLVKVLTIYGGFLCITYHLSVDHTLCPHCVLVINIPIYMCVCWVNQITSKEHYNCANLHNATSSVALL